MARLRHVNSSSDFYETQPGKDSPEHVCPQAHVNLVGLLLLIPAFAGQKGFLQLCRHTGPAMGSSLGHWAHGNPNLKKAVLKGGAGRGKATKKKHQAVHTNPKTISQRSCLKMSSPHPLPPIKNKDKNKPRREGRKNLTKIYVCFRPIATTALLSFHLPLRCFLALDCKKQSTLIHKQQRVYTAPSVLCCYQKLETGVDGTPDGNCYAQESWEAEIPASPRPYYKDSCKLLPPGSNWTSPWENKFWWWLRFTHIL